MGDAVLHAAGRNATRSRQELLCVFLIKASAMGVAYPVAFTAGTVNFPRQEQGVWKVLGLLWMLLGIIIRRKKGFLGF